MRDHPLTGLVVPIVTPMSAPDLVDLAALDRYLDALAQAGVTRIMAFGSNGEGASLSTVDCLRVIKAVLARWRAVPNGEVLAAVIAPSTALARHRAAAMCDAGVGTLVVSPPVFFRHTAQELVEHFSQFQRFGVQVAAYDNRRYSGNPLTSEVVSELVAMPHMIGLKDSSGSLENLRTNVELSEGTDFVVSQGDDKELVTAHRMGAGGATAGAANLLPRAALELWQAAENGDQAAAARQQELLCRVNDIHRVRPGIATTKFALSTRGLIQPHASSPFLPLTSQEKVEVLAVLDELDEHLIRGDGA